MKLITFLFLLVGIQVSPYQWEESSPSDTGNLQFEFVKEKIIIPVQINNKTYRFLVDTGGIFEISEALQNEFNFNQIESTTIVGINKKEIEIQTVTVPEIKIGNWSFKDRKAIVSDLHSKYPYSCFELDGMIGRDFFDKILLHFDLATHTFRLTENEVDLQLNKDNRTKLKLSRRGLPDVKLKINGKKEFIEFDSGSGDFYSPKTADVEDKLGETAVDNILSFQGLFSFGITMENIAPTHRYMQKVERFEMANTTFHNFYSQFSKVSAPRIGAGILKYGKVTLDYKNGWFYFEPYSEVSQIEPFTSFGFDIAIENGNYRVKWTLEKSEAHAKGLRSGTVILSIDDQITQNIQQDCEGYLNGYAFKNKESISVRYLDDQQNEKTIQLTKKSFE